MKSKTVLSPQTVQEIKRMYAEVDSNGRRRWSQMQIADHFGIGETTVYRAIRSAGGYRGHREPPSEHELAKGAAASLARLMAQNPDLVINRSLDRMEAEITAQKEKERLGDMLIDELKNDNNG